MTNRKDADDEQTENANGAGVELEQISLLPEQQETNGTAAPERSARPRAARRAAAREIGDFGEIPEACTAWGVKRETRSGLWEPMSYGEGAVEKHEWPLSELSNETIMSRWGFGTYKTQWWRPGPGGGRKFICQGTPVTYSDKREAPPPPSPFAPPNPLTAHLEFMRTVRDEAMNQNQQIMAFAAALAGNRPQGLSFEELRAVMREEREAQAASRRLELEAQAAQTQAAIAAAVAPLQAAIAELRAEEEEGGGLADAAAASLSKTKKGGFLGWIAAVAEHKDLIKETIPVAAGMLNLASDALKTSTVAQQVAAQQRPQAKPRETQQQTIDVEPEDLTTPEQRAAWERLGGEQPSGAPASS